MKSPNALIDAACRSRAPVLFLLLGMAALYLGLPYSALDGDVAMFGTMGADLLRHGCWPTFAYGQNYLISPTPYLFAFWRWLLPAGVSSAFCLALGGALLSISGMGLVLAGFRHVRNRQVAGGWPTLFFVLLLAGNVPFMADHAKNSGVEISLFLLGLMVWAGARLEARPATGLWVLLGAAIGYGAISRPQMIFYGLPLAGLLGLNVVRASGFRAAWRPAAALVAGMVIGYSPMLLHRLVRADQWPFLAAPSFEFGTGEQIVKSMRMTIEGILPTVFGMRPEMAAKPVRYAVWVLLVLPGYGWALWKGRERLSVLDHALVLGSLAILAALVCVPALSVDGEQRRYAMSVFVAGVWLCCRHLPAPGWRNVALGAVCVGMLAVSGERWGGRLERSVRVERQMRGAQRELVEELAGYEAALLANYWDASLLQFLSEGRLKIESFPWGCVRTYGWVSREAFDRRTLWLVPQGRERALAGQLRSTLGLGVLSGVKRLPLKNRLLGQSCELWEFPDPAMASRLMENAHPLYFRTPYPPGSGAIRGVRQKSDGHK